MAKAPKHGVALTHEEHVAAHRHDDPPPRFIGRIGESQGEDSIDRLCSLSEAAEKRAVEDFKERLLGDEVCKAARRADKEAKRRSELWPMRAALEAAIEAAEEGAS